MTISTISAPSVPQLTDQFGRVHRDLRISLTDRCSLRCTYCMPADGVPCLPARTFLTSAEILRVARIATELGVTHVRLTGGEPLLRHDILDIVESLAHLPKRPEVSITTNGLALAKIATPLAQAGLTRVNVSLDTLDRDRFRALTRREGLSDVLAGLAAAKAAGLQPVKINTVLLRGVNDDEAPTLLRFALAHGYRLRFIEQMPLGPRGGWDPSQMIRAEEILDSLRRHVEVQAVVEHVNAPARRWLVDGGPGEVGIIAAVSAPFCGRCDRIRLTADGQLRNCLFAHDETDLRSLLRSGADDGDIATALRAAVEVKAAGHRIGASDFTPPPRPMSAIGG